MFLNYFPALEENFVNFSNSTHYKSIGGARGLMVIVVGNGHGDTSSNPGQD